MLHSYGISDLVSVGGNYFGPVTLVLLLKTGFAILCFNFLLFLLGLKIAFSIPGMRKAMFGLLLLLNIELLPAIATLNKEIFTLFAAILTAKYVLSPKKSFLLLVIALVVSFLARWEQAGILVLYLLFSFCRPFRGHPRGTIAVVIAGLSVFYPLMFKLFGLNPDMFNYLLEGARTIIKLDAIQNHYGFPIVVGPKIFLLIAGKLASPEYYTRSGIAGAGFTDVQQTIFQPLGCLAMVIVTFLAFAKRRLGLGRPLGLLIWLTLIISAVAPFVQPRYAYPVYVLMSLELARRDPAAAPEVATELS